MTVTWSTGDQGERVLGECREGGLRGCWRAPWGSADSEEGQGKSGSGEHCGPVPTEMLLRAWPMRPALPPGLAGTLLTELAQCRQRRSEAAGALPLEDSYTEGPFTQ